MRKPSLLDWLSTCITCFIFWTLLTWSLSVRDILLGLLVSGVVAAVTGGMLVHESPFYMYNPVRLGLMFFYVAVILMREIIKANIEVAKIVLLPEKYDYREGIIRIKGADNIKSRYGLSHVANCITMTPGTITLEVAEDENGDNYYYIHWLNMTETDRDKAGEMIKGTFEKWLGRIWK